MALVTFVDDNAPYLNAQNLNKIQEGNTYSTSEIEIGKWIDGKPIYRKIYTTSTTANNPWTNINFSTIGLINIDYIYFANGTRKIQDNKYIKNIDNNQNINIDIQNSRLSIGPADVNYDYTFVFEYTKSS